ncbi:hypothetical protein N658DRAFT_325815 [Parathielavia hyrcaniae]|uniref:Uncharacterized protein n=1 Tax=Parathielavia hyrcaniae TaxID=113614 RepID=A0AAN6Q8E1_9PEZI|nr:hypothetical protein N658DRAFT_325815 [Parathielavia hyrcaniae]
MGSKSSSSEAGRGVESVEERKARTAWVFDFSNSSLSCTEGVAEKSYRVAIQRLKETAPVRSLARSRPGLSGSDESEKTGKCSVIFLGGWEPEPQQWHLHGRGYRVQLAILSAPPLQVGDPGTTGLSLSLGREWALCLLFENLQVITRSHLGVYMGNCRTTAMAEGLWHLVKSSPAAISVAKRAVR